MKTKPHIILFRILFLIFLVNLLMFFQQPAMIFYPYKKLVATPADWQLTFEEVTMNTEDGVGLHGWYLPHKDAKRVLLFFHGNGGNISHRGDSLAIFHRLAFNVFIFDYRGYGQSGGRPSEAGLHKDAQAAWQYLTHQRGLVAQDIILFGRSLGGAVAARLAAEVQPGALILESTFSSARDMAQSLFPLMSHILVMRYDFKTSTHIKQVHCPVMVVHSPDDDIIPFHLGQKVYAAANQPKFFTSLKGDHNSGFLASQPGYEQDLARFMELKGVSDK